MPTMKSVRTAAPGTIEVAEIQRPAPGPRDLLVRVRACGICGTDAAFVQMGGMPLAPGGQTASIPLGHEPAGEVVEIGAEVTGLKTGDRVVVNPQAAPSGTIGCGGTPGGGPRACLPDDRCLPGRALECHGSLGTLTA
jgi:(R,R)-butanediol dehydrogenase/meso-butanediol dehydrogenase/diacetyl reductase